VLESGPQHIAPRETLSTKKDPHNLHASRHGRAGMDGVNKGERGEARGLLTLQELIHLRPAVVHRLGQAA